VISTRMLRRQHRTRVRPARRSTGCAGSRFPGIDVGVRVDPVGRSVTVRLEAPLDLPLTIPGSPSDPTVGASSTAAVTLVAQ